MNIHDKAPLQKQSTTKSCKLFSQKISTTYLEWAQNRPSEWEIVLLAKIQELKTIQNSKTQMMQITYNICKVKTPTIMSLQKLLVNWEKCLKIKSIEYSVLKVLKTILKVLKPVPKSPPAQIIQIKVGQTNLQWKSTDWKHHIQAQDHRKVQSRITASMIFVII